ncbi:MAG: hypothetical protein VYB08_01985 [Candidatus Latescibacterota bacterium]|nr:hypothetical protein [Candidatus Latescibacterota bacterium]
MRIVSDDPRCLVGGSVPSGPNMGRASLAGNRVSPGCSVSSIECDTPIPRCGLTVFGEPVAESGVMKVAEVE